MNYLLISNRLIFLVLLIVHVIVPSLSFYLGWSWIYGEDFKYNDIVNISFLLFILFIITHILFRKQSIDIADVKFKSMSKSFGFIILIYSFFYVLYGGLTYRYVEITGIERTFVNNLILVLTNVMVILSFYSLKSRKLFPILSSLVFIFLLIFSGGRGLMLQLFLMLWLYNKEKKQIGYNNNFFELKDFVIFIFLFITLGMIGVIRDSSDEFLFSSLLRLSEPYWYIAKQNSYDFLNTEILNDILNRFTWAITRVNFLNIEGNIDGNDYYLPEYLGISLSPGVSLPITLVGQGFLLSGIKGVVILLFFGILIYRLGLKILMKVNYLPSGLKKAILLFYISKIFNFHAKSITGLWTYFIYETIRDIIVLIIVVWLIKILIRRTSTV